MWTEGTVGFIGETTTVIRANLNDAEAMQSCGRRAAIGGWMSGAIFDATLSYRVAFLNGFAWNLLNMAIAAWLLLRLPRRRMARLA